MRIIECEHRNDNCTDCHLDADRLNEIIAVLKHGGLVVYPTETLYALGADVYNENALNILFKTKNRPLDAPVSIALKDLEQIERVVVLNEKARNLIKEHLPGALTILTKKREDIKLSRLISKSGTVGIRIPDHPLALKLVELYGSLTATSANLHGDPDPKEIKTSVDKLGDSVEIYIDCGPCKFGRPSTVVDVTKGDIKVIRAGPIPTERLLNG